MSYRCSYCMAVCPAGEDVKPAYLKKRKEYVERVLRPLKDRKERVYVMAGSNAEKRAGPNPHKELRIVPGVVRFRPQVSKDAEA
jgi:epoxyqueuosine reductase